MRYVLAVLLLTACSGGEPSGPTAALFDEVQTKVRPMQAWAEAETTLKGTLGEPTSTEGDVWTWNTTTEPCSQLTVAKMGAVVGTVSVAPCP